MATSLRYLHTSFWADEWVQSLTIHETLLFIYFLTNHHSSWCGAYKISIATIAFESKLYPDEIKGLIEKLAPKVFYVDGWVFITNFEKYHMNKSDLTKKGIAAAWDAVPSIIRLKIADIKRGIEGGIYPLQGASSSASTLTSTLTSSSTALAKSASKEALGTKGGMQTIGDKIKTKFKT